MAVDDGTDAEPPEPDRSRDPLVGTVINGKFHVQKTIARGGMGRIYYGTQAPLDRPVALKIVKADAINEGESQFLKRFLREASILAKLQHPNVVTLFDYGRIEGAAVETYFIAMEYLGGETLAARLSARGSLGTREMLVLFRQIARGLREAHEHGIVHRDLKPSNILIVPGTDGEIVKLVDFGIGKVERSEHDLTRDGMLVGTPKYMAPEQFDGASSPASDVYALGIIAYQMLTGEVPFRGRTMAEFVVAKLQHPVPTMRAVNPHGDASEAVESLIYGMLSRAPEARPSLDDVFGHLAACEAEIFGSASAPIALTGSGGRPGSARSSSRPTSGPLKVPYTIVAPQPPLPRAQEPARPSAPPIITGLTPRPMATSARPGGTSERAPQPVSIVVAFVLALLAIGAVGIWFAKTSVQREASRSPRAATSFATPSARPAATSFKLHLDSNPSGASVTEDGRPVGVTPLEIEVERKSVARGPRTFQLKKDAYVPTVFAQSSIADDRDTASMIVELTPAAAPSSQQGGKAPSSGGMTKAPPASQQGDLDIRLRR